MTQNTSSAVMAQRSEPHDSLDFFPTPPWATRALCQFLGPIKLQALSCWEPACGEGHMARPLGEYFDRVYETDVCDYGFGAIEDFLFPAAGLSEKFDWIITNPPFRLAQQFALHAMDRARAGVALLVRTAWLESVTRYAQVFRPYPPSMILQFAERVPMVKGRLSAEASTATSYCWVVWQLPRGREPTSFHWLSPCRARLERPGDYP